MISNTSKNLNYFLDKGIIENEKLTVRSVKAYLDGALGSRGALLKNPYSDTKITRELQLLQKKICLN